MAKKKSGGDEGGGGSPAWMATFSDLMNLLLCFFVLLFSMSSVDAAKFEEVAASLNASFSIFDSGAPSVLEGGLVSSGVSQLTQLDNFQQSMGSNQEEKDTTDELTQEEIKDKFEEMQAEATEELAEKIEAELEKEGLMSGTYQESINIEVTAQYVTLTLNGAILYDSGKAELKATSGVFMDKLGNVLKSYNNNDVEIKGFTDSVPVKAGGRYKDNMELSQARAYSVYRYLVDKKNMSEETLECSGRGEQEPVASNDTAEGRALNRRVEIRIYSMITDFE